MEMDLSYSSWCLYIKATAVFITKYCCIAYCSKSIMQLDGQGSDLDQLSLDNLSAGWGRRGIKACVHRSGPTTASPMWGAVHQKKLGRVCTALVTSTHFWIHRIPNLLFWPWHQVSFLMYNEKCVKWSGTEFTLKMNLSVLHVLVNVFEMGLFLMYHLKKKKNRFIHKLSSPFNGTLLLTCYVSALYIHIFFAYI